MRTITAVLLGGLLLTGCAANPDAQIVIGPGQVVAATTTIPDPATSPPTTGGIAPPTTASLPRATVPAPVAAPTTVATTPATSRLTTPPTTRPAMSRAEANSGLCRGIENADRAVVANDFYTGGLRLAGAIGTYAAAAEPAIADAARRMLSAGVAYDSAGYVQARSVAAAGCAAAGYPITVGGMPCSQQPCI